MRETQISAHISQETRERVERYADAHGMKKGALVEQALLHHLQALRELPQTSSFRHALRCPSAR